MVDRAVAAVFGDAEPLEGVLRQRRFGVDGVGALDALDGALLCAVDPHVAVDDPQRIARQGDAALDVVLALVHGARDDGELPLELLAALLGPQRRLVAAQRVVVGRGLVLDGYRVAGREVEDHHVVALDAPQPAEPVVGPADRLRERLARLGEGHGVVDERERERRVGHLGAVGHLAHVEVVAHEQRFLHRRGGDDIHLEDEDVDERRHDRGEDDGVDPLVDHSVAAAVLAQTGVAAADPAVEVFRDVEVVDHRDTQQQPEVAGPYHEPERIEERRQREAEPFVAQERFDLFHRRVI